MNMKEIKHKAGMTFWKKKKIKLSFDSDTNFCFQVPLLLLPRLVLSALSKLDSVTNNFLCKAILCLVKKKKKKKLAILWFYEQLLRMWGFHFV